MVVGQTLQCGNGLLPFYFRRLLFVLVPFGFFHLLVLLLLSVLFFVRIGYLFDLQLCFKYCYFAPGDQLPDSQVLEAYQGDDSVSRVRERPAPETVLGAEQ